MIAGTLGWWFAASSNHPAARDQASPSPLGNSELQAITARLDAGDSHPFRETLPSGKSYEVLDFGTTDADNWGPKIVPEGHVFVMGDNRDNSQDGRFVARPGGGVGWVPLDHLVGRASVMVWSTDGSAEWIKPWTWFSAARWERMGDGV